MTMTHIPFPSVLDLAKAEYRSVKELYAPAPSPVLRALCANAVYDANGWHANRSMPSWLIPDFSELGQLFEVHLGHPVGTVVDVFVPWDCPDVDGYLCGHPDARGEMAWYQRKPLLPGTFATGGEAKAMSELLGLERQGKIMLVRPKP